MMSQEISVNAAWSRSVRTSSVSQTVPGQPGTEMSNGPVEASCAPC